MLKNTPSNTKLVAGGGVTASLLVANARPPTGALARCLQAPAGASHRLVFKAAIHPAVSLLEELQVE